MVGWLYQGKKIELQHWKCHVTKRSKPIYQAIKSADFHTQSLLNYLNVVRMNGSAAISNAIYGTNKTTELYKYVQVQVQLKLYFPIWIWI